MYTSNQSLKKWVFPNNIKLAKAIPILNIDMSIAFTGIFPFSKILEKFFKEQLYLCIDIKYWMSIRIVLGETELLLLPW